MKKLILAILIFGISQSLTAQQLNVSYVGNLQYDVNLSDIWGYAAPDGTEYALVGANDGLSIVSLADPANPTEVAFIPGGSTIWRDIKTWDTFAYVTADSNPEGLLVVDLSGLPNSVDSYFWQPTILGTQLGSCHNLWIDEFGWAYLAGCGMNGGGVLFVDVHTDPYNPVFVGAGDNRYAHDVWVKDNIMYTSDLGQGLNITDVSSKSNIQLLGTTPTPLDFTHNAWATVDHNYVFTTDEKPYGPVAAYDISNLNDIQLLDAFVPTTTLGDGVIPHNVHEWNDFLIVSYYTDGCIIIDASKPDNLIEVGNFDTFIPTSTGFSGAWGAYPFLPSGLILVSDINTGLYVLEPNYVKACYLEGKVTEAGTGSSISSVRVDIESTDPNLADTDNFGDYKTGQPTSGIFDVTFSKVGYESLTTQAVLVNGQVTILDVELTALIPFNITGIVTDEITGDPVPGAQIIAQSNQGIYSVTANANGEYTINNVFADEYSFFVGSWGYLHEVAIQNVDENNNTVSFVLKKGYQDDFIFELDWQVSGDASTGMWERGFPIGTGFQGSTYNPDADIPGDLGEQCYFTENGNGPGGAGNADVDDGITVLTSPVMDLTTYIQPIASYYLWFANGGGGGGGGPNDSVTVHVTNGTDTVLLESITSHAGEWLPQSEFILSDLITITDQMHLIFTVGDFDPGHLVEAGVDAFLITEGMSSSTKNVFEENIKLHVYPNPFDENITIQFDLENSFSEAHLNVYNLSGQQIQAIPLSKVSDKLELAASWQAGIYFITIEMDGKVSRTLKIVKQ